MQCYNHKVKEDLLFGKLNDSSTTLIMGRFDLESTSFSTTSSLSIGDDDDDEDEDDKDAKRQTRRIHSHNKNNHSSKLHQWRASLERSMQQAKTATRDKLVPTAKAIFPSGANLLSLSRIFLTLAAVVLLLGENNLAVSLSTVAITVFQDAKRISHFKGLDQWLLLSCRTIAASFLSILLLHLSNWGWWSRQESDRLWFLGMALPKLWGVVLGSHMYQHFGALHFLQINVRILQGRNIGLATRTKVDSVMVRSKNNPYVISIRHGPTTHVGKTRSSVAAKNTSSKNNPVWNEQNQFRVPVLSTSIQIHKHMECHIFDHDTEEPLGMVQVPIPTLRNLKVVHWYPIESSSSSSYSAGASTPITTTTTTTTTGTTGSKDCMGKLFVEIEVRSQSTALNLYGLPH
jgi:hypothetical protein